jgi:chaperone required for assembly of F1-ATPase
MRNPMTLPPALEEAVASEWKGQAKFVASKMPLTSLAYTAIDRIAPQKDAIVEALLVYADTDTLCYRAPEEELKERQKEKWDLVLGWSSLMLGTKWEVAEGIMPLDQPPKLHEALKNYLSKKDEFELAAFSVLAAGFSSLVLAKAVCEKHLSAAEAFTLSRLEEDYSNEKWGEDTEAKAKATRLKAEMLDAGQFLKLLDAKATTH